MIEYMDAVGKSIPNTLKMAQEREVIKGKDTLMLYGFYEYTGFSDFFKKVRQGIKARKNG
jgi:hypothetical protein